MRQVLSFCVTCTKLRSNGLLFMLKMNCTNVPFRLHIFQFQLHKKGTTAHYFKACSSLSDFGETWYEWCKGKGLKSYTEPILNICINQANHANQEPTKRSGAISADSIDLLVDLQTDE